MTQKSKKQITEELMEAMYRFIQLNPPDGFRLAYFQLMTQCGRIEEATQILTDFNKEETGHEREAEKANSNQG
jgi:hypothetical protein